MPNRNWKTFSDAALILFLIYILPKLFPLLLLLAVVGLVFWLNGRTNRKGSRKHCSCRGDRCRSR